MKQINAPLEGQNKVFRQMLQECNGKIMNYECCRLLEEAFIFNGKHLVESFVQAIETLKDLKEKKDGKQ